jgi:serine/threonine-protein kinase
VDFGVANGTAYGDPDKGDSVKGKFGYMSPEQANGEPIDRRTDVFALGIVLFELTTGERLFKGELPAHTLRLVQAARIPHPARFVQDYPERLAPIVLRALERDRKARYQTAEELCQALEHFLVTERMLVSHASVGKLVQKVLRSRLEQQDSLLQKALVATDGLVQGGLVPPASPQAAGPGAARISDPSHPSASSSPFQQKAERHRRAPIGAVLFGALGVCSAVGSIVWTSLYAKPNALLTAPGGVAASGMHAAGPSAGSRPADGKEGVSLDSIPLAEAEAQQHASRGAPPVVRRTHVTLDEDPPPPSHPSAPERIQLDETQPAAVKPPAPTPRAPEPAKPPADAEPAMVNLEDQPPPPAKPAVPDSERGPLNRGAAVSALAAAGGRAAACSNPDGPSGSGRAMVTFSPDGPATGVALQPPFAGTTVGSCVVNAFKSARVPAFTGSAVTLPGSFRVP